MKSCGEADKSHTVVTGMGKGFPRMNAKPLIFLPPYYLQNEYVFAKLILANCERLILLWETWQNRRFPPHITFQGGLILARWF